GPTPGSNDNIQIQFTFWMVLKSDSFETILAEQTVQFGIEPGLSFHTVTLISDYVAVGASDKVFIRHARAVILGSLNFTRAAMFILPTSTFYNEPKANHYSEGDTIFLAQTLNCEIDLLSLAK